MALSACSFSVQSDGLQDKLRVETVSVVFAEISSFERFNYRVADSESIRYSTDDTGLTKEKIASDFSAAPRRELIPSSRNGQRPVDVEIQLFSLTLVAGPNNLSGFWSFLFAYDLLLKATPAEVKGRLLK